MDKAIILLPTLSATGGPESLHNLANKLNKHGIDTKISTNTTSPKILNYFAKYDPKYIPFSKFHKEKSFIIIPETQTFLLKYLSGNHKAIWWLSFLNHRNSLRPRYKLRNYGIGSLLVKDQLKDQFKSKNLFHLIQTNSSKNYLINNYAPKKDSLIDLESPINEYYYKKSKEFKPDQNNLVLINSAKHSKNELRFIKKFLEKHNYHLEIVQSKTRSELINLYIKSKFYLDFGPHPGQERMPRESTMLGCYSIVGLRGTARNYHDFPLPYFSKIECGKKLGSKELIKAVHLMDEINNGKDLGHNNYRKYVEEQPLRFNEQILNLVNLIKTA